MTTSGSPFSAQPYQGIATFGRRSHTRELSGVDVAILGVPYDSSTSYRSGARFGPRAIREQSLLLWGYNNAQQVAPFEVLNVVDYGDVDVIPVDIAAAHRDSWDAEYPTFISSHGTPFRRAIEEGLFDTTAYLLIGIRGPTAGPQD